MTAAVVWLKRDLRLRDHAPLRAQLAARGLPLLVHVGEAAEVLTRLHRQAGPRA